MNKTDKPSPAPATSNKPDAARRALLRGVAVGIPTVVTLASGSAWGAAGSIPCFNLIYSGKITGNPSSTPGSSPYLYNGNYTIGTTTVTQNAQVTRSNTSEFCWNSGAAATGFATWGQLPP